MGHKRGYTYHNKKYGHKSRLDYFLLSTALKRWVQDIKYVGKHLSDHSAVSLILIVPSSPSLRRWTLERAILLEDSIIEKLTVETESFFQRNLGTSSIQIVWDAYKVFIRGQIPSVQNNRHKEYKAEIESKQKEI